MLAPFQRGWAPTPGVTNTAVGRGDSASALPHHLPFQCFERALRYLVFVGLFLLNNNDEQHTDPLPRLGCFKSTS